MINYSDPYVSLGIAVTAARVDMKISHTLNGLGFTILNLVF